MTSKRHHFLTFRCVAVYCVHYIHIYMTLNSHISHCTAVLHVSIICIIGLQRDKKDTFVPLSRSFSLKIQFNLLSLLLFVTSFLYLSAYYHFHPLCVHWVEMKFSFSVTVRQKESGVNEFSQHSIVARMLRRDVTAEKGCWEWLYTLCMAPNGELIYLW